MLEERESTWKQYRKQPDAESFAMNKLETADILGRFASATHAVVEGVRP
jgi:hypothetical protein